MAEGKDRSYYAKFKFVVEIDGVKNAGFQKCSALESEAAIIEYNEGGTLIPNKSLGRLKFSDVTLSRGATDDLDLFSWFDQASDGAANAGAVTSAVKRNLDIVQQARDGSTLRRWRVFGALPMKFKAGDWDNDADENVIEEITLAIDYFKPIAP